MITGNKKDIAKLLPYVSQRLGTALQYIAETNFTNVKNGEYHLDGDKVFARVDRYTTEPRDSKKPESHNAYIDVQYLGEGTEKIYYTAKADTHKVIEDYAAERDLLFTQMREKKTVLPWATASLLSSFPGNCTVPAAMPCTPAAPCRRLW